MQYQQQINGTNGTDGVVAVVDEKRDAERGKSRFQ
jgi:hypothetical protein